MNKFLFTRSKSNPILGPNNSSWWKVYNPGAIMDDSGITHLYPRVMKKEIDWHSRIAHATSNDGENFKWSKDLAIERRSVYEKRGVEDPRITKIGKYYYMVFAAYNGKGVNLHSARSLSPNGPWSRLGKMVPDFDFVAYGGRMVSWKEGKPKLKEKSKRGTKWSKSGALFSEKFNHKYMMVFGEFYMWLATSLNGKRYEVIKKPLLKPRKGDYFDNTFIETGPPPIITEKGWILFYHGIDEAFRYQLGFVILDKNDPSQILFRTDKPVFGPEESYEIGDHAIDVVSGGVEAMSKMSDSELKDFYIKIRNSNIMPQVTFCTGAILHNNKIHIYYGAGDTTVCTAYAELADILAIVKI